MKGISISRLEQARNNPSKFGKDLKDGMTSIEFHGYPKSLRWFDAVLEYHKTNNLSKACTKLEHSFSNRKDSIRNRKEVENLTQSLYNYVDEYNDKKYNHIGERVKINIELSPILRITGWIWLLERKPNGSFVGLFISKDINELNWHLELRFPIIQEYIANNIIGCSHTHVEVGIIDFLTGKHYITTYSKDDLQYAVDELNSVGTIISTILQKD